MIRRTTPYLVQADETLDEIARRFKLPSGDILSNSPRNPALKGLSAQDAAPVGRLIHIPSDPRRLLQERYNQLSRINQVLRSQFDEQSKLLEALLAGAGGRAGRTLRLETFDSLQELTLRHVVALESECRPITEINSGLADAGEVVDPADGLTWLLFPSLLNEWRTFWRPESWKLANEDSGETKRMVLQRFNTLRSRVLQQAEARARVTVLDLQRVMGPSADSRES